MVSLQLIAQQLFDAVAPSRVTIRGAAPGQVDTTTLHAEILAPTAETMRGAPQGDIVVAPTYRWLQDNRRILVQADCREEPLPPKMLTQTFHVGAQLLGPLMRAGELVGTISVHQQGSSRAWATDDVAALARAVDEVAALWGLDPGRSAVMTKDPQF